MSAAGDSEKLDLRRTGVSTVRYILQAAGNKVDVSERQEPDFGKSQKSYQRLNTSIFHSAKLTGCVKLLPAMASLQSTA